MPDLVSVERANPLSPFIFIFPEKDPFPIIAPGDATKLDPEVEPVDVLDRDTLDKLSNSPSSIIL